MALAAHFVIRRFAPNADPLPLPIALVLSGLGYVMVRRLNEDLGRSAARVDRRRASPRSA